VLDLHGDVYVAIRAVLAARDGTEQRKVANTTASEFRFLRRKL
jgi:hypothetical protein